MAHGPGFRHAGDVGGFGPSIGGGGRHGGGGHRGGGGFRPGPRPGGGRGHGWGWPGPMYYDPFYGNPFAFYAAARMASMPPQRAPRAPEQDRGWTAARTVETELKDAGVRDVKLSPEGSGWSVEVHRRHASLLREMADEVRTADPRIDFDEDSRPTKYVVTFFG